MGEEKGRVEDAWASSRLLGAWSRFSTLTPDPTLADGVRLTLPAVEVAGVAHCLGGEVEASTPEPAEGG